LADSRMDRKDGMETDLCGIDRFVDCNILGLGIWSVWTEVVAFVPEIVYRVDSFL